MQPGFQTHLLVWYCGNTGTGTCACLKHESRVEMCGCKQTVRVYVCEARIKQIIIATIPCCSAWPEGGQESHLFEFPFVREKLVNFSQTPIH